MTTTAIRTSQICISEWKTIVLHALHVHFSFLDTSQTFSFFPRREMTCFAVVWTTWASDDKCSNLCSYFWSTDSTLIPGWLEHILQSVMTLNNWEVIAETRSYMFRWPSRCCRHRVCFSKVTRLQVVLMVYNGSEFPKIPSFSVYGMFARSRTKRWEYKNIFGAQFSRYLLPARFVIG